MKYLERVYWQHEQYYNEKKFFNMMKNIKKADDFKKYLFNLDCWMNPIRSDSKLLALLHLILFIDFLP